jgi:hypothetical protein
MAPKGLHEQALLASFCSSLPPWDAPLHSSYPSESPFPEPIPTSPAESQSFTRHRVWLQHNNFHGIRGIASGVMIWSSSLSNNTIMKVEFLMATHTMPVDYVLSSNETVHIALQMWMSF